VTGPRTAVLAHPYRDLRVIDARAPRFNQAVIGLLALAGVLTGAWPLFGLAALQLVASLALGRRWCLACVLYFELVQPRLGEGPLEDSRPVRFANQVGATFLGAATLAGALGFGTTALVLGGLVAGLALLAAATGLCVGCLMFKGLARWRGTPLTDAVAAFADRVCADCQALPERRGAIRGAARPWPVDHGHGRTG
jgi:hypothetical protein